LQRPRWTESQPVLALSLPRLRFLFLLLSRLVPPREVGLGDLCRGCKFPLSACRWPDLCFARDGISLGLVARLFFAHRRVLFPSHCVSRTPLLFLLANTLRWPSLSRQTGFSQTACKPPDSVRTNSIQGLFRNLRSGVVKVTAVSPWRSCLCAGSVSDFWESVVLRRSPFF